MKKNEIIKIKYSKIRLFISLKIKLNQLLGFWVFIMESRIKIAKSPNPFQIKLSSLDIKRIKTRSLDKRIKLVNQGSFPDNSLFFSRFLGTLFLFLKKYWAQFLNFAIHFLELTIYHEDNACKTILFCSMFHKSYFSFFSYIIK